MKESLEFMTYERRNSDSMKWDGLVENFGADNLLPLWIADMDIKAPLSVRRTIHQAAENGIYGYYLVPDRYYQAFIQWETRRHHYTPKKESIRFMSGIVAGLFWCVQIYTQPKDACLVLTPSYAPFLNSILSNDRTLVCSELINENGIYSIDFHDFEQKIVDNNVKMFFLCSPHNPSGRVWTKEELLSLFTICKKHDVLIVSDEIHQDMVLAGGPHIPALSLDFDYDKMILLTAASKTFNLAGFQNSFAIIPDESLRQKFDHFQKTTCVYKGNRLGYEVVTAAYEEGEDWLEDVLTLLRNNHKLLQDAFASRAPHAIISPMEGTYLTWVDLTHYVKPEQLLEFMVHRCHIALDLTSDFYPKDTPMKRAQLRFNLATSPEVLTVALDALLSQIEEDRQNG